MLVLPRMLATLAFFSTASLALKNSIRLNTGSLVPALGFGTYQLAGDELRQALSCAIAAGYRHIDTAAGYENEHIVAESIAESGVPRDDLLCYLSVISSTSYRIGYRGAGPSATSACMLSCLSQVSHPTLRCQLGELAPHRPPRTRGTA